MLRRASPIAQCHPPSFRNIVKKDLSCICGNLWTWLEVISAIELLGGRLAIHTHSQMAVVLIESHKVHRHVGCVYYY